MSSLPPFDGLEERTGRPGSAAHLWLNRQAVGHDHTVGEPLNQLFSDVACKASMTQARCACAGLDDTLSVGEEGSAATLAHEELHAALREVGMQHLTLTAPGPCP